MEQNIKNTVLVKTSVSKNHESYFLLQGILLLLKEREELHKLQSYQVFEFIGEADNEITEGELPILQINDEIINGNAEELFTTCFSKFEPHKNFGSEALHYWLRASSSGSGSIKSFYQHIFDKDVTAALIANGANLIKALKL